MAFFFFSESLCGAKNRESDSLTKLRPFGGLKSAKFGLVQELELATRHTHTPAGAVYRSWRPVAPMPMPMRNRAYSPMHDARDCHPWIECLDSKCGIKNPFGYRFVRAIFNTPVWLQAG
jgi:hypothetical protein